MPIPGSSLYPNDLDTTLSMFGYQTNQTEFTLTGGILAADTNIPITPSPATMSFPQLLVFTDNGEIAYTTGSLTSGSLVVERPVGSTAHTVSGSSTLRMVMFAEYLNQLRRGIFAIEGELGVTPSGTSSTVASRLTSMQTELTNTSASITAVKARDFAINVSLGDGTTAISGSKSYIYLRLPYSGNITSYEVYGETSGSITVDVWKSAYADLPSSIADSICGSNYIYLSASATNKANKDTTLTGWTKTFSAGDWLTFYTLETPAPTATQVTVVLIGKVVD